MPDGPTVANTSCLIALEAIERLVLLEQLYQTVVVPATVAAEFGASLPPWIDVRPPEDHALARALRVQLGAGEADAIALAAALSASRLILDDKKARGVARQLNLPVTGTLAVLLRAKSIGLIPKVSDLLDALIAAGFRISGDLRAEILHRARE